jgi:hypothetical protein
MRLSLLGLFLSCLNLVLFYLQVKKFVPGEGNYDLTAIVAIVVPILFILALRGMYRDQKLVKSLDRLR